MASDKRRIEEAARRYGRSLDPIAARYTNPTTGKRLSGEALILKTIQGESGGRRNAVSSAGAKGWAQFMPVTRAGVISQFGVDPWRSPEEAVHALTLHMRGKLGNAKGLEGYNPGGGQGYVNYILGQKVGATSGGRGGGGGRGSGGSTPAASGGPSASGSTAPAPSASPAAAFNPGGLSQAMGINLETPQLAPSSGVAMPAALRPQFYQEVPTSGPPQPPPEPDLTTGVPAGQDVQFAGPGAKAPDGTPLPTGAQPAGAPQASTEVADPKSAKGNFSQIFERMAVIDSRRLPYKWGGGHGAKPASARSGEPLDCSGAVSAALGVNPRVSGQFASWGKPGAGGNVTVYANKTHVLMKIRGDDGKWHFWGTSHSNPEGGAGWIPADSMGKAYLSKFTARHI